MFTKVSDSCQIPCLSALYEKFFHDVTHGTFVEVGGHDGVSFSNTWGLAENGWRGLYYEPIRELCEACRVTHAKNDVTVVQTCVGSYNGEIKLYTGVMCSTSKHVMETDMFNYGMSEAKFLISDVCTLDKSLTSYNINSEFELLVIDVEGAELDVLAGINLDFWKPHMIIIEACKNHPDVRFRVNSAEIDKIITSHGYREEWFDGINSVYVHV